MDDRVYMQEALRLAHKAATLGEVPVGCVVVCDGKIVGRGYNRRETAKTALGHAELDAIAQACETLGGWRLSGCTLYVTLEPCPMCAGAIINARIDRVVCGAKDEKAGSCGSLVNLFDLDYNHKPQVEFGVMEAECTQVLQDFFGQLRAKQKKIRCKWPNLENNTLYITYHDQEWGVPSYDDGYLFEMLVLESFHCGLSWLLVLKKRKHFRKAFDGFRPERIAQYGPEKIQKLLDNPDIIRNKQKILATIQNAKAFLQVQKEFGTFSNYIWSFTHGNVQYGDFDLGLTTNELSDKVSKDLKKRGFGFLGSVTTYSYLEAIGVMNNHSKDCFCYKKT